jgi:hypothetical protein
VLGTTCDTESNDSSLSRFTGKLNSLNIFVQKSCEKGFQSKLSCLCLNWKESDVSAVNNN